jgi:hypothetical protein
MNSEIIKIDLESQERTYSEMKYSRGQSSFQFLEKVDQRLTLHGISRISTSIGNDHLKIPEILPILKDITIKIKSRNPTPYSGKYIIPLDVFHGLLNYFTNRLHDICFRMQEYHDNHVELIEELSLHKTLHCLNLLIEHKETDFTRLWNQTPIPSITRDLDVNLTLPLSKDKCQAINRYHLSKTIKCKEIISHVSFIEMFLLEHGMTDDFNTLVNFISQQIIDIPSLDDEIANHLPTNTIVSTLNNPRLIHEYTSLSFSHGDLCPINHDKIRTEQFYVDVRDCIIWNSKVNNTEDKNTVIVPHKDFQINIKIKKSLDPSDVILTPLLQESKLNDFIDPKELKISDKSKSQVTSPLCLAIIEINDNLRKSILLRELTAKDQSLSTFFLDIHRLIELAINKYTNLVSDELITNLIETQHRLDAYYRFYDQGLESGNIVN